MTRWIVLAALLLAARPACAVEAHYAVYAAGLNVVDIDAQLEVTAERYRLQLGYRTVGAFGLLMRGRQDTTAEGRFVAGRPVPERFYSAGVLRGGPRVTQIDYRGGEPTVRQLVPPNDTEREAVPAAEQRGTVDTLSALAQLVRQVNETGRCDGRVRTFDGRRLSELEVRTGGDQVLDRTGRSSFAGTALRCDFVGRQVGGFMLDEDRERLRRPQEGTAWFAQAAPGGPRIPVRVAFHTRWFGDATMYLVQPGG